VKLLWLTHWVKSQGENKTLSFSLRRQMMMIDDGWLTVAAAALQSIAAPPAPCRPEDALLACSSADPQPYNVAYSRENRKVGNKISCWPRSPVSRCTEFVRQINPTRRRVACRSTLTLYVSSSNNCICFCLGTKTTLSQQMRGMTDTLYNNNNNNNN